MSRLFLAGALVLSTACSVNVDNQGHIERDDRKFVVDGVATLDLSTFDGVIEVRGWDRNEVEVGIEKRAQDKDIVDRIQVTAEQKGDVITVDVRYSGSSRYIGVGVFTSPTARLIVSAPRRVNVTARTGDGSVVVDRLDGRIEIKTMDGSVRATETSGTLLVESGDGSIRIEDVAGVVEARTDDGTVRVTGVPSSLRVRSGDGSVVLCAPWRDHDRRLDGHHPRRIDRCGTAR